MIRCKCPCCQSTLELSDTSAGVTFACPNCSQLLRTPALLPNGPGRNPTPLPVHRGDLHGIPAPLLINVSTPNPAPAAPLIPERFEFRVGGGWGLLGYIRAFQEALGCMLGLGCLCIFLGCAGGLWWIGYEASKGVGPQEREVREKGVPMFPKGEPDWAREHRDSDKQRGEIDPSSPPPPALDDTLLGQWFARGQFPDRTDGFPDGTTGEMTLILRKNGTFSMEQKFIRGSTRLSSMKGTYRVDGKSIVLVPNSGGKYPGKYDPVENSLFFTLSHWGDREKAEFHFKKRPC